MISHLTFATLRAFVRALETIIIVPAILGVCKLIIWATFLPFASSLVAQPRSAISMPHLAIAQEAKSAVADILNVII